MHSFRRRPPYIHVRLTTSNTSPSGCIRCPFCLKMMIHTFGERGAFVAAAWAKFLYFGTAYLCVHSFAVAMAAFSSSFQRLATSAASGSSGLGAPRRAWMDNRMVRICSAGDQLSVAPCQLLDRAEREACDRVPTLENI